MCHQSNSHPNHIKYTAAVPADITNNFKECVISCTATTFWDTSDLTSCTNLCKQDAKEQHARATARDPMPFDDESSIGHVAASTRESPSSLPLPSPSTLPSSSVARAMLSDQKSSACSNVCWNMVSPTTIHKLNQCLNVCNETSR